MPRIYCELDASRVLIWYAVTPAGDRTALHPILENVSFRKAIYQDDPVPKIWELRPSSLSLPSFRVSVGLLFYRLRVPSIHSRSSVLGVRLLLSLLSLPWYQLLILS